MPVVFVHKNHYDGAVYPLGNSLVTGNHPLLAKHGWIRADCVNDIADVLRGEIGYDCESVLVNLKSNKTPSSLSKQHFLSSVLTVFPSGVMPVAPINFDSDFSVGNGEVNVIDAKGELWSDKQTCGLERFKESVFKARKLWGSLVRYGSRLFFPLSPFSMRGDVSCFKLREPLLRGHSSPYSFACFSARPSFNSRLRHSFSNRVLANTEFLCYLFLGCPNCIHLFNFLHGESNHKTTITTRRDGSEYKGLVYNLQVAKDESYCVGTENFVVHNCIHYYDVERVGAEPELEPEQEEEEEE